MNAMGNSRGRDLVADYAASVGWVVKERTVIVEGTTDVELFNLAASIEKQESGANLVGSDLQFVAGGRADRGGTSGVIRELLILRNLGRTALDANGRPKYRFVGLFDNDKAGRGAVKTILQLDSSVSEYKDVFRLQPAMPCSGNLDPKTLEKSFCRLNAVYKGLDWELEDLLSNTLREAFLSEYPSGGRRSPVINGKWHCDLSRDGKARFHRFVKENAIYDDLAGVIAAIKAIRCFLRLPS